ncbi:MliC family protein [Falsirhodobacter deserti]|uniref:MliC family protein n=1 Tax=Falsirhodobacter deserti TaxID=1365611 RepID=UPI001F4EC909|nr:MliC family protein [Falsirhodobacter deserti]
MLALVLFLPALAQAGTEHRTMAYTCDRGVQVPATYVTADDLSVAVLNVEGSQITLEAEQAASGVRYGWPSGGSHYVWWTKGPKATLYWRDGEADREVVLLTCARN